MPSRIPPYLLPVLQRKVAGYTNQAIADELGYSLPTIETYVKRVIQFFRDEGLWEPQISHRTGLLVCGRRYLETLAPAALDAEYEVTAIYPQRSAQKTTNNGAESPLAWINLTPAQIEANLRQVTAEPFEVGSRAILLANRFYRHWLCTKAIPIFQLAEDLLGSTTNLAAKAACSNAQMYIEIGDLHNAKQKIITAQRTYEAIADPEIRSEMQHINGWIDYSQGNLHQAEAWYRESLHLAAETGVEHLSKHAHHFLGCIYRDWGSRATDKQQADEWFHQAELHLDTAYRIHRTWGDDGDRGYDLLRKAQLRQLQNRNHEAQELRAQASALFDSDVYTLSIEVEEAQICLKNQQETETLRKAEKLLESWVDLKGTRGIADALRLIGDVRRLRGQVEQALELSVAALCTYPYPNCQNNRTVWRNIAEILHQSDDQLARKQFRKIVEKIEEQAGPFVYLKSISADRSAEIAQIIGKLAGVVISGSQQFS